MAPRSSIAVRYAGRRRSIEKARNLVEDIVLSFNRELKRESDRLELISFKVEGSSSKGDASLKKVEGLEKRILPVEEQLSTINQTVAKTLTQNNIDILSGLGGLESKIKDIGTAQETLRLKITDVEGQIQKIQAAPPEVKVQQVIPVLPIKRDKALAALTDTEIAGTRNALQRRRKDCAGNQREGAA